MVRTTRERAKWLIVSRYDMGYDRAAFASEGNHQLG